MPSRSHAAVHNKISLTEFYLVAEVGRFAPRERRKGVLQEYNAPAIVFKFKPVHTGVIIPPEETFFFAISYRGNVYNPETLMYGEMSLLRSLKGKRKNHTIENFDKYNLIYFIILFVISYRENLQNLGRNYVQCNYHITKSRGQTK